MNWLLKLKPWHFLILTVLLVELLTALMSELFRGMIAYDYLLSGGIVSLIVASAMIYLFTLSSRLQFEKDLLQEEIDERIELENTLQLQAQMIDILKDSLVTTDLDGSVTSWNKGAERLFGYTRDEAMGKHISFVYPPDEHDHLKKLIAQLKERGQYETEVRLHKKSGEIFHAILSLAMIKDAQGVETGMLGYSIDITERKAMEEALRKSEEIYRAVVNTSPLGIHICDTEGKIILSNPAHHRIFETPDGSLVDKYLWDLMADDAERTNLKEYFKFLSEEQPEPTPAYNVNKTLKGRLIDVKVDWDYIRDGSGNLIGFCSVVEDITEKKKTEDALKQALKDKDMLIREVHHRVKNNLAVIQSLLKLQAVQIKDTESLAYFKESQNRVKAMSMIHERLYRSDDLSSIDFSEYVKSLSKQILGSYDVDRAKVRLHLNVPHVRFDIDNLIPCGLILNELITNALKHAFPDGKEGELSIEMLPEKDTECTLIVKDNGIGIPSDIDIYHTSTLGMQIVTSLVNQLKGTLELNREEGTEFRLSVKTKPFQNQ